MSNTVECIFEVKTNHISLVINIYDDTEEQQQLLNCESIIKNQSCWGVRKLDIWWMTFSSCRLTVAYF